MKFKDVDVKQYMDLSSDKGVLMSAGNVGGDLTVNSDGFVVNKKGSTASTTVGGNLTAKTGKNSSIYNMTVTGDADITSGLTPKAEGSYPNSPTYLSNFKSNNLTVKSSDHVSLVNGSEIKGNANIVAGTGKPNMKITGTTNSATFFMGDSKVGKDLNVETEHGAIHVAGGSIGGNANLTADSKGTDSGNIIIGYNSNDPNNVTDKNSTSIGGNIKAKSNLWTKAYSDGDLKFVDSDIKQNISAESKNGNVSFTNSVAGSTDLTAGKDATIDNSNVTGDTNIKTVDGNATVKNNSKVGKLTMNSTNADVNVIDSTVNGTATLTAGHDVNSTFSKYTDKLDATAGHDVNYKTTGDINLDNSTNMSLKAGNKTELTTIDGNITVDNLPSGTDVVKGKEVSLVADGNITFTGDNVIDGDLRVKSTGGNGFVAINGDSTKADNIYVDKAHWVEIKNVDTDHLQMENFDIGHLIQSRIGSAGFNNGDTLYINILNTVLNGQLVKNLDPAFEINRGTTLADIIYYPLFNPGPGAGDGGDISGDDAARLLGYMREKGIDGLVGKDFAPIAFAAYDRGKRGAIFKAAGDAIYKDVSQVVHITDRFNLDD